ncbi:MAG TPA: 3'(2'),5'-bisphosphate nucleotidase CysQ [Pseudolabrys sp.]|nr:3'(2'),5'-bisphosphate nucleotidase CysQ [Pseudolabrys sp.]
MAADLLDDLTGIVAQASAAVLANPYTGHRVKDDQSPVTPADEAAEAAILEGLARLLPGVPVVSEEATGHGATPKADESFVLVDPLDGTKQFIEGLPEYTVNVAIVSGRTPIAGVIAAPAHGLLWRGVLGVRSERLRLNARGGTEKPAPIRTRPWPAKDPVAIVSRSHFDPNTDALLKKLGPMQRDHSGSSIKFCRIAEGIADIYPRLAPTSEWDIAAGHALVVAAGGAVLTPQGAPLHYGGTNGKFLVPGFIAWGDPTKAKSI